MQNDFRGWPDLAGDGRGIAGDCLGIAWGFSRDCLGIAGDGLVIAGDSLEFAWGLIRHCRRCLGKVNIVIGVIFQN
ncbi:MAG: hypothetical protein PUC75_06040 [Lachnospiraceae bacterium]|nr:hypothetical protein [Lachnospiraceae bacterium]MDD6450243.1 hypothetical protein [Lachnospiraceae bacterium]